ncbi:MAG TPA: TrbG/VirB9 family P-type conjugative transfer protein, partial [Burkholderiaceae bacterium]|nr:TrbG/VirB9 family P-type conjugative transfer protein [Burkholderiaceae bacterium]
KNVVTVGAKAGVATMVEFGPGEHVLSVATGQGADCAHLSDVWCVAWPASASFVFVRPKSRATTPLTLDVVTDRHSYGLQFDPIGSGDTRPAVFRLVFTYPQSKSSDTPAASPAQAPSQLPALAVPLVSEAQLIYERMQTAPVPANASYTIAYGKNSQELAPAMVFDDGRFTYIRWAGNREIPAVFEIRADGSELLANTRMEGDLIVVDRIARGLMLRSGTAVASLRNERFDPDGASPVAGTTVPGVERVLTPHGGRAGQGEGRP